MLQIDKVATLLDVERTPCAYGDPSFRIPCGNQTPASERRIHCGLDRMVVRLHISQQRSRIAGYLMSLADELSCHQPQQEWT